MPSFLLFHEQYWDVLSTHNVFIPPPPSKAGYPTWQATVIAPSLFGMIGAWLDTKLAQFRWWKAFYHRITALSKAKRSLLLHTLTTIESPHYAHAFTAVQQTSQILGFNKPDAWIHLKRELKDQLGESENVMRHLEAVKRMKLVSGSTFTNPQAHFLVELAYQGRSILPRRLQ